MKLKNLSTITKHTVAIAGLLIGISGVARADDITYQFESDPQAIFPDSEFNGSTITLTDPADPTLLSWDIKAGGSDYTAGTVYLNTISSYDLTGFSGLFGIQDGSLFGGEGVLGGDGAPGFLNPDGGYLQGVVDPIGWWTEISDASTGTVPDAAGTLALLSGAMTAMASVRYGIRRQAARK